MADDLSADFGADDSPGSPRPDVAMASTAEKTTEDAPVETRWTQV